MNFHRIIKGPVVTERATFLKEKENKYVFKVDKNSNKNQIKNAIEELFNVKVVRITTMIMPGKLRRMGRNMGYRSDWKKAVIQVKPGQEIKVVEESR